MATYVLTFADGRGDVEVVADMFREEPPFIEFVSVPAGGRPQLVASYRDDEVVRIASDVCLGADASMGHTRAIGARFRESATKRSVPNLSRTRIAPSVLPNRR